MNNENYEKIAIKCSSQSEKLAALYHLSKLSGLPISNNVLGSTIDNKWIAEFPYVKVFYGVVSASTGFTSILNLKIVEFKDLPNVERIVNELSGKNFIINSTTIVYKNYAIVNGIKITKKALDDITRAVKTLG